MKREIKFRGKNLNGDWVYGNLSKLGSKYKSIEPGFYISNRAGLPFAYHVRPETVGLFTGLKDISGNQIFEGDIVKSWYSRDTPLTDIVYTTDIVEYEINEHTGFAGFKIEFFNECEVIGNIYDNPELKA